MRITQLSWLMALSIALAGCAGPPTADIDAARAVLDTAQKSGAPDYAPEAWNAAKDSSSKLDAELAAQDQRWTPMRSYAQSRELAQATKADAERAAQAAATGKDKAKSEAATMLTQARDACTAAQKAVSEAPRGKGTEADLASLKSDATGIEDTLKDMQAAYDSGDYLGAKSKAQAAIDASHRIQTEIDQAKHRRGAA